MIENIEVTPLQVFDRLPKTGTENKRYPDPDDLHQETGITIKKIIKKKNESPRTNKNKKVTIN
jgi:hypothetical protein